MTSNVGAQKIIAPKKLGFDTQSDDKKDYETMKNGVMEEVKRLFKPEFINRIDEIMVFHQLNEKEMMEIVTLLSDNLAKRCRQQLGIELTITPAVKKYLVHKYADAKMGARPLKRAIQSVIEDAMAEDLLKGNIRRDSEVIVGLKDEKITFTGHEAKNMEASQAFTSGKTQTGKKPGRKATAKDSGEKKKATSKIRKKDESVI